MNTQELLEALAGLAGLGIIAAFVVLIVAAVSALWRRLHREPRSRLLMALEVLAGPAEDLAAAMLNLSATLEVVAQELAQLELDTDAGTEPDVFPIANEGGEE